MAASVFTDKSRRPTDADVRRALGDAAPAWRALVAAIEADYPPVALEWNCYSAKSGWIVTLRRKKRPLLYLTPQTGRFLAGLLLHPKAMAALDEHALPKRLLDRIAAGAQYPEGRAVVFQVRRESGLKDVLRLLAVRMAH